MNFEQTINRIERILEAGRNSSKTNMGQCYLEDIRLYADEKNDVYVEPGYDGHIVLLGNWNQVTQYDRETGKYKIVDKTPARVADLLERLEGVELEWADEWGMCDDCYRLVRVHGDSYCWQPYYWVGDGYLQCAECCAKDLTE